MIKLKLALGYTLAVIVGIPALCAGYIWSAATAYFEIGVSLLEKHSDEILNTYFKDK